MSIHRLLFVAAALLLASLALAQDTWFETGSLTTVIDGEQRLHHTYGTLVADDVADGVEDPAQRAFLESIAGTEQHTASYELFDELAMGGIVIAPATLWLALTFRFGGHDSTGPHGVTMQVPLDPSTLTLTDPDQVEITYYPKGPSYEDFYALTDGVLTLDLVEVVDDVTLRVGGSFSGYLTHQTDFDIVHDPSTAVEAHGEFLVERVVGSLSVLEMLGGE